MLGAIPSVAVLAAQAPPAGSLSQAQINALVMSLNTVINNMAQFQQQYNSQIWGLLDACATQLGIPHTTPAGAYSTGVGGMK